MYDFIRLETSSESYLKRLLKSPLLADKTVLLNTDTGGLAGKMKNQYKGLTFELFNSGRIVIYGSLHKYFNSGKHNYNDFGNKELREVLNDLKFNFGNEILNMKVTALEFGLNLNVPFSPKRFIDRCISFSYIERSPILKTDCKGFDKGISFNLTDYRIKIYNKSKQYSRPENILRLENKYLRNRAFKSTGIIQLIDILKSESIDFLFADLYNNIKQVIYKEDFNEKAFSMNDQRIYSDCINPMLWSNWNKVKRSNKKNQYQNIIKKHALSSDKEMVLKEMKLKFEALKSINHFHDLKNINH